MTYKRGAIYLANLNPAKGSEPGKTRPCVVMQSNLLSEVGHRRTAILPMTSRLVEAALPLRVDIAARDDLRRDSQILVDQPRAIDNRRFASGELATLTKREMAQVDECLKIVLGLSD